MKASGPWCSSLFCFLVGGRAGLRPEVGLLVAWGAGASGAVVTVASPGQARGMTTLLHAAGVHAKNVDARRVARPFTASSLVDAPEMEPLPARDRPKSHGARRGGGRPGYRAGARNNGRRGQRRSS